MLTKLLDWIAHYALGWILVWTLLIGIALGWQVNGLIYKAKLAVLQLAQAERETTLEHTVNAALAAVLEAERKGDALTAQVVALESERSKTAKEKDREIQRLTTGRACLGADVVRLLNAESAPGSGLKLPTAASGAAGSATGFASDTDVGLWAVDARTLYDTCRGRVDALREWRDSLTNQGVNHGQ
jgi:hypothetical protein